MKQHIIFISVFVLVFSSCQYGTPEYVDFGVVKSNVAPFMPTWEGDADVLELAPWEKYEPMDEDSLIPYTASLDEENGVEMVAPRRATSTDIISVVRNLVDMFTCKKVHQVAGIYKSIDVEGLPVTLSGKVFYPENKDIKGVILVSHFTIGANFEAPSRTFSLEGVMAAKGYLVIVPDYLGYGASSNYIHPYLQGELTARNVIDMALAVIPWMNQRNLKVQSGERDIILFGYSQGGATTMHVQKLLELDDEYMDEDGKPLFHIIKNFCGAGPYNVAKTYDYAVKVDKTGIPCAVPMIIQGMSQGLGEPLDIAYFFKEPLLSNYDEWINSKKYTVKQINMLIDVNRLSDILTAEGRNKSNTETQRLYRELTKHSISLYYVPQTPMYIFHSMDDLTVPFVNSQLMRVQFDMAGCENITYDFGHYGDHTTAMLKFLMKVLKQL